MIESGSVINEIIGIPGDDIAADERSNVLLDLRCHVFHGRLDIRFG